MSYYLILYIAVFSLFLSLLQGCYNYRINKNNLYLTGFLIVLSTLSFLHFYMVSDSAEGLAVCYGHFMPFYYLMGPFLYFYVKRTLNESTGFNYLQLFHYLPFLIALIGIFPYYFQSFDSKIEIAKKLLADPNNHKMVDINWLYNNIINLPLRVGSLSIYTISSLFILIKSKLTIQRKKTLNNQENRIHYWLFLLLILTSLFCLSYINVIYIYLNSPKFSNYDLNSITLNYYVPTAFVSIPVLLLIFPKILYGIPMAPIQTTMKTKLFSNEKHDNSGTVNSNEVYFQELTLRIIDFLNKERPYKNNKFGLDELSKMMQIPKHHLYYCFNTILKTKFTTVRTQMRVDFAKECLLNGDLNRLSMEGVWIKTGFSSRTNFFVSFKEVTGQTPLEFIKTYKLEPDQGEIN